MTILKNRVFWTGVAVVAAALTWNVAFVPSLHARPNAPRFEYVRVTPYLFVRAEGQGVVERVGYRACVATSTEWTCRQFESTEPSDVALRTALVTLGNEGWELVSAVDETPSEVHRGLTYLFKRPE